MEITAALVKELREITGAGMMDAKKALVATDGDKEKAIDFLREKGLAAAAKKADRVAAKPAYLKREEVPEDVIEHEKEVLRQQALNEGKPEKIVEKMIIGRIEKYYKENCLLDQEFIKDSDKSVGQVITEAVAKIGEKIDVRRYVRYELGEGLEKCNDDFVAEVMAQAK